MLHILLIILTYCNPQTNSKIFGEIHIERFGFQNRVENELIRLIIRSKELKTTKANQTYDLTKGINVMTNLHNLYDNSNIEGKQRIIGSTFPRNFIFEENKVRTEQINEAVRWITSIGKALRKNVKGKTLICQCCPLW